MRFDVSRFLLESLLNDTKEECISLTFTFVKLMTSSSRDRAFIKEKVGSCMINDITFAQIKKKVGIYYQDVALHSDKPNWVPNYQSSKQGVVLAHLLRYLSMVFRNGRKCHEDDQFLRRVANN